MLPLFCWLKLPPPWQLYCLHRQMCFKHVALLWYFKVQNWDTWVFQRCLLRHKTSISVKRGCVVSLFNIWFLHTFWLLLCLTVQPICPQMTQCSQEQLTGKGSARFWPTLVHITPASSSPQHDCSFSCICSFDRVSYLASRLLRVCKGGDKESQGWQVVAKVDAFEWSASYCYGGRSLRVKQRRFNWFISVSFQSEKNQSVQQCWEQDSSCMQSSLFANL